MAEKTRLIDPVTAAIVAVTLVAVLFLMIQSGVIGTKTPKIAIIKTDSLLDVVKAKPDSELALRQERIRVQTQLLVEEGYVVLRSEAVRGAPDGLYVEVIE